MSSPQVQRLIKALPAIAKSTVQVMPVMMQGFISKQFGVREVSDSFRDGTSDSPFANSSAKNRTDKLRVASRRLLESYDTRSPDNFFEIQESSGKIKVDYGTRVEYARINELGGTIDHPGGTDYMIGSNGLAIFLKKGDARSIGQTKPHKIKIPARPSLAPAFEEFKQRGVPISQLEFRRMAFEAFYGRSN